MLEIKGEKYALYEELEKVGGNFSVEKKLKKDVEKHSFRKFLDFFMTKSIYSLYRFTNGNWKQFDIQDFLELVSVQVLNPTEELFIFLMPWNDVYMVYTGVDSGGYDAIWKVECISYAEYIEKFIFL